MNTIVRAALLVAGATVAGQAGAQSMSSGDYGSAVAFTKRNCPATAATACDGRGSGQGVAQRGSAGGEGQQINASFTATGTGLGSNATASVAFGGFGLPNVKSSVKAVGDVRVGAFVANYQSYTYRGQQDLEALILNASFHIVDSSTDRGNGTLPGGAIASAGFAIWNKADFFAYRDAYFTGTGNFANPTSLTNQGFLFGTYGCQDFSDFADPQNLPRGPRATNAAVKALTGGETTIDVAQQNCNGEQTLTLEDGDEFVIASFTQLIANRNGFVDATGTFTMALDPTMAAADQQAFRQNTTFASAATAAVPEPASWAMMIAGFGLVGGAMRRRAPARVRALA